METESNPAPSFFRLASETYCQYLIICTVVGHKLETNQFALKNSANCQVIMLF
jgi:hypothetical protein